MSPEKVQIFLANDRFIAPRLRVLHEAARFLVRFLFGFRRRYLFPYRIACNKRGAFLVGSQVHERELVLALGPITTWVDLDSISGVRQVWGPKLKLLRQIPSVLVALAKSGQLSHFFHFLYNLYNYEVTAAYLELLSQKISPKAFGCFELVFLGASVSDFCARRNLTSIFIQHGLFDQACLPYRFDEYHLWHSWDRDFFSTVDQGSTVTLKYSDYAPPSMDRIGSSKVLFFALEYPGATLRWEFIIGQIDALVDASRRSGWRLIVRPHPRDTSGLAEFMARRHGPHLEIDPYSHLPVLESFKSNSGAIFMTLNSAAIVDAHAQGIFCLSINNPLQDYIRVPFSRLSTQLQSARDVEPFLQRLSLQPTI